MIRGVFNQPGSCLQGHADFLADSSIRVTIPIGQLLGDDDQPHQSLLNDDVKADAIYGLSQDGYYQTLIDVRGVGGGYSAPGFAEQCLSGTQLYVSRKIIEPNPTITSFTVKMAGLREWVRISPFVERYTPREDGSLCKQYSFSFSEEDIPKVILFESDNTKVTLEHNWVLKGGSLPTAHFVHCCESDYDLSFSFHSPIHLDDAFRNWVLPVRSFICFCMGMRSIVRKMQFLTTGGAKAEFYIPLVDGREPRDSDLRQMPITWSSYGEMIPAMLSRWLELGGQAKDAAKRSVSLLDRDYVTVDTFFLATAQAFEAISRVGVDQNELDQDEFNRRLRCIETSGLEPKIIKWTKRKLKYANNKSATELAKTRIEMLGSYGRFVLPNAEPYLREHRDTRNYFTHLDPTGKTHILSDGLDAIINADTTYLLLYGAICQLLGFDPDTLVEAFKQSGFKWSSIMRSQERYGIGTT